MADAATWSKRVAEWRASGLTAAEFCAGREFSTTALYWWSSRIPRSADRARPATMQLARVVRKPRPLDPRSVEEELESPLVLVELGGVRIVVSGGVGRAKLAAVFAALDERERGRTP